MTVTRVPITREHSTRPGEAGSGPQGTPAPAPAPLVLVRDSDSASGAEAGQCAYRSPEGTYEPVLKAVLEDWARFCTACGAPRSLPIAQTAATPEARHD